MKPKTRTLRTPTERAIAALGVEQRRVDKLTAKRDALMAEATEVSQDLMAAERRRDYLAQNPDLPEANTDPIPGVDQ
jgi:hypothetical protein